jgi:glycerophosphoryl diester phosphodiesterase
MRNRVRAVRAALAGGIAVALTTPIAYAQSMDEVTVAHRGASTSKLGEGTLPAYKYAVRNRADILDADVRWTKDGPDADNLGTMVILHDATLDRVTNCTGAVSSWLWSEIHDRCRTDIAGQQLLRVVDLLSFANSVGKSVALEIKVSSISDAQAEQLWSAIKNSRIQLQATSSHLDALNKIKKLDAADTTHKISYALIVSGSHNWPSVSTIRKIAPTVHARLTIPADVARSYRLANIKVFLYTGKNASDDAKMIALQPYGVVVDDVARFQQWRDAATGSE